MARRNYVTNVTSDINPAGAYQLYLNSNPPSATFTQDVTMAGSTSATGYTFTRPLRPGAMTTSISNFTVGLDVTVGDNKVGANVQINRINSTGTVQTSSSLVSAGASGLAAAIYTISFTNLDLGTFSDTDRIRVDYVFNNTNKAQSSTITLLFGDKDSVVYAASFYPLTYHFT